MTNFMKGLLVIGCQVDEDANNKISESKDHSSKLPRNISEKRMFGKNVRCLSKLVTRALLNPHKQKKIEIILANSHVFKSLSHMGYPGVLFRTFKGGMRSPLT